MSQNTSAEFGRGLAVAANMGGSFDPSYSCGMADLLNVIAQAYAGAPRGNKNPNLQSILGQ